jgi:hypothetical protein
MPAALPLWHDKPVEIRLKIYSYADKNSLAALSLVDKPTHREVQPILDDLKENFLFRFARGDELDSIGERAEKAWEAAIERDPVKLEQTLESLVKTAYERNEGDGFAAEGDTFVADNLQTVLILLKQHLSQPLSAVDTRTL